MSTKQKVYTNKLKDYFGADVNIGDLVFGATPRKNYYQDTSYSVAVVIDRTAAMVRLHKLGEQQKDFHLNKEQVLEAVASRYGSRGGKVNPQSLINLGRPTGLTKEQFDKVNVSPVSTTINSPFSII